MNRWLGWAVIVAILIVGVGLVVVEQNKATTGGILGTPPFGEGLAGTFISPTPVPLSPGGAVPEGWQRLQIPQTTVSLWYPVGMQVSQAADGSWRMYLAGPTQREGTEVYDGILMTVDRGTYEATSFEEFARQEYESMLNDPATLESFEFGAVNVSGREAFRFAVTGLGTFTHVYVPLTENRFLLLVYLVADPTGMDYQAMVETMMDSIAYGS